MVTVINIVDPKARTRPSWKSGRPPWGGDPGGLDRICDDAQVTPPSVVKKTRGPNSLSSAGTKPCCASMNDTLPLQGVGTMPIAMTSCQVAPPSVVCQNVVGAEHGVTDAIDASQPSRSLTKEIMGLRAGDGSERSSHVLPRSVERKSREPATSTQATFDDGASTWATFGSAMGVGVTVGLAVALGEALGDAVGGVPVALGVGVVADGWHAAATMSAKARVALTPTAWRPGQLRFVLAGRGTGVSFRARGLTICCDNERSVAHVPACNALNRMRQSRREAQHTKRTFRGSCVGRCRSLSSATSACRLSRVAVPTTADDLEAWWAEV